MHETELLNFIFHPSTSDLSTELVGRLQVRDQLRTEQDAMLLEVQDLTSLWNCRCLCLNSARWVSKGSCHTNIRSVTAFEHCCESDSPPQTSQSVPPTVGLNSQSLWRVSLQYLDSQLYSMFLMLLSVLYIYMGNCLPVSTSSCFKLAYNTTSFVKQAQSQCQSWWYPQLLKRSGHMVASMEYLLGNVLFCLLTLHQIRGSVHLHLVESK